ncbi:MAG: NAD-dependent epimerase/dehydratase family protein [Acidobacteriota bacterium]
MATAFLTGGTGFLGGHVARALSELGWRVRLLARDPRKARDARLAGLALDVVPGDLSDQNALAQALSGADAIVHAAGLVNARSLEDYRAVNVRGTEQLLAAARRSAPDAMFVHVSSQAAAGPAREGRPVLAGDPARPVSWYGVSKHESELAVSEFWKGPWVILRPGVIFGPGDRGLFVYFRMAASGWIPLPAGQTRVQVIAAEQSALAIARAASRRDLTGQTGFLCDPQPIRLADLAGLIATLPRRPARILPVPNAAVRLLGRWETLRETLTGKSRPFNADKAREILAGDWLCEGGPMRQALDLPPDVSLAQSLRAAWDWYRAAGWL